MIIAVAIGCTTPVAGASTLLREPVPHHSAAVRLPRSTAPDTGGVGLRLVDIPVDAATDPRAHQYIVDHLAPGMTVHRRVEVSNTSGAELHVAMFVEAATVKDGSFVGGAGDSAPDLAVWTTLSRGSLEVPPGAVAQDTVTIVIPSDASPGERYGVVWAEVSGPSGGNITLVNRVGIRMYVSVGDGNPPDSAFTVDTMTAQRTPDGVPRVEAQVHNTGGRALDLTGTLMLSGMSGSLSAGPYPAELGTTLAPGQSNTVRAIVTDAQVADGPWNATIVLQSGLVVGTYQAQITFPHQPGTAPPVSAHEQQSPGLDPLLLTLMFAILAGIVGLIVSLARQRRARRASAMT